MLEQHITHALSFVNRLLSYIGVEGYMLLHANYIVYDA